MADKTAQKLEDLLTLYKATLVDLPLAGARWGWGMGEEKEVVEAAWKGYDAGVRLASTSVDDLYRDSVVSDFMARSLDGWLRWQRLSQAAASAFFAALWPAVGLPTAAAVQALSEELRSVDTRLKAQDVALQTLRAELLSLMTDLLPAQRPESKVRTELVEQLAAMPAQRNSKETATTNATPAGLPEQLNRTTSDWYTPAATSRRDDRPVASTPASRNAAEAQAPKR